MSESEKHQEWAREILNALISDRNIGTTTTGSDIKIIVAKLNELEGAPTPDLEAAVRGGVDKSNLMIGDIYKQGVVDIILAAVQPFCGETDLSLRNALATWKFAAVSHSNENKDLTKLNNQLQADNAKLKEERNEMEKTILRLEALDE